MQSSDTMKHGLYRPSKSDGNTLKYKDSMGFGRSEQPDEKTTKQNNNLVLYYWHDSELYRSTEVDTIALLFFPLCLMSLVCRLNFFKVSSGLTIEKRGYSPNGNKLLIKLLMAIPNPRNSEWHIQ